MAKDEKSIIPVERIASQIYLIRGEKVMLDSDLAELYGVETKVLNQAVKRNIKRFPSHFMFELTHDEFDSLRSQTVTLKNLGRGQHRKYFPYAFTEHGELMLSSVLRSEQAVKISIAIIDAFIHLRKLLETHKGLAKKIQEHDLQIANLYEHVQRLLTPKQNKKNPIGYIWKDD